MARLLLKLEGSDERVIELKLGVNRLGRSPKNDFQVNHLTVSSHHCNIILGESGITVHDADSTNGTYINDERVQVAELVAGQMLRLGDVELYVDTTDVKVEIPRFDIPIPAPPVVLTDGSLICPRHPGAVVTHQCTNCREVLCDECVSSVRRRGGKLHKLCKLCSFPVERLGEEPKKKKTFFSILQSTVKLPFLRNTGKR